MGVTLKELATTLGLSPTTVSRALNGYPEVNTKTRERVMSAARAANYHPNTRAKSLATGQSRTIGHVIPVSTSHEIVNPVFADFIAGAGETYSNAGYDMVLSVVSDAEEENTYRNLVARGTVDGLMVHGPHLKDDRIRLLHELGLPFMVHGRSTDIVTPYSWLDINNRRSFRRATEFLIDLGHTRIALVNGLERMDFATRRRTGYLDALTAAGISPDADLMRSAEMTEPYGHQAGRDLLQLPDPPTAFLASSMIVAYGLRRALTEAGLRLGRDVSVITHDDDLSYMPNGLDVPQFTATCSSVRVAGRKAAEMLLALVNDPQLGPLTHLMETRLVLGDSTGRNPA